MEDGMEGRLGKALFQESWTLIETAVQNADGGLKILLKNSFRMKWVTLWFVLITNKSRGHIKGKEFVSVLFMAR